MVNKKELISELSARTGASRKMATDVIDAFADVVGEKLASGELVKLVGFGTFEVSERKSRKGINPRTKQVIEIAGGDRKSVV